ncbi:retrovirus-related pol polyprotein from transposon TNT 1-94 [Tanacetum coccineum]
MGSSLQRNYTLNCSQTFQASRLIAFWEVIVNGDAPAIASASAGTEAPIEVIHGIKDAQYLMGSNQGQGFRNSSVNWKFMVKLSLRKSANLKLLRSLPSAWNNIALIMRDKSDLDTLSIDDLYNNLKVTNEAVNTAHDVTTASSHRQTSSLTYVDDVMFSFFANQSNSGHAYHQGGQDSLIKTRRRVHFAKNVGTKENQRNKKRRWSMKESTIGYISKNAMVVQGNPQYTLQDQGIFDSRCSRNMTGNKSFLTDYQEIDGGFELKFNLFFVSQMCDKKNSVLFTETECLILSPDFKLLDESQVLLKVPRHNNMYSFDQKNVLYGMKRIKREFSIARTSQQNGVTKRKNRTLIEAARTMLSDLLLPTTLWAEAVNTACYVHNRVLVTKPHNKTPYELLHGRPPSISFMRPFGCPVTILNTLDPLGKFDGKADEGFLVGYSINSKAFRVFNTRTRKVEENLHINFFENKPNVAGSGPKWLFDYNSLTKSMNNQPVTAGNQTNKNACIKDNVNAVPTQQYILLPLLYDSPQSSKDAVADDAGKKTNGEPANEGKRNGQDKEGGASNKEDDQNVQDLRVCIR